MSSVYFFGKNIRKKIRFLNLLKLSTGITVIEFFCISRGAFCKTFRDTDKK